MANANNPGSGYEVDIEGSICTGPGTYAIQWCYVWPVPGGWGGGPSISTELRVVVHNRGRFSTANDVSIDVDCLSDSVNADVLAKLTEYAIEEEQRDWERDRNGFYPIRSLREVAL